MALYLDHNATMPVKPAVADAVARALTRTGNPSSVHGAGRAARRIMEQARAQVAALVDAPTHWVVFTGSGTEANNLALLGLTGRRVLVSAVEHDSVLRAVPDAIRVPVDANGVIDLTVLDQLLGLEATPALISVMLANNETGVLQSIEAVVAIARRHGALVHTDAVQAIGRMPVSMTALGVDLMTISAHKIGGAPGAAALVVSDRAALAPRLIGGGQERGRRAGTENIPAIAGFGVAAELAGEDHRDMPRIAGLRDRLEAALRGIEPTVRVFGANVARLANTSCIALPGAVAETQVMALDLAGIAVSAGSACSSGKVRASHVLTAMGAGPLAGNAIRVSLGWTTIDTDIDTFIAAWTAFRNRRVASHPDVTGPMAAAA